MANELFMTLVVEIADYPGFLSFLSENLLEKKKNQEIDGFHVFRYKTQDDEENDQVHVQLEVRGASYEYKKLLMARINDLIRSGLIIKLEPQGWRFQQRMFGVKGGELARDIFELATEFSINAREKFGRLLDPQNEFPEEVLNRFIAPGMWLLFSAFCNTSGYTPIQEINAYLTAIQTRLQLMKPDEGEKVRRLLRVMIDMI